MKRQPAFTCFAALVLAIGIASVAAMVAVVDAIEFPALPFQRPDRIVFVERFVVSPNDSSGRLHPATTSMFERFQGARTLSSVAAFRYAGDATIHDADGNAITPLDAVSSNYFATLGLRPLLGRFFVASDTDVAASPVVVITYDFWTRHLDGDPRALGSVLRIAPGGGAPVDYTIIGILPAGLPEFTGIRGIGQFIPLAPGGADTAGIAIVGRLRPGATLDAAQRDLSSLLNGVPGVTSESTIRVRLTPLEREFGYLAPARFALLAIAALVLAIAALNVANLIVARGASRALETALRIALGASPGRTVRQFVAESAIITILGSAVAIPLAVAVTHTASTALDLARGGWRVEANARVLVLLIAVVVGVGCVCGLLPAFAALKHGARGIVHGLGHVVAASTAWSRLTDLLFVAQVGGAFVLAFSAATITREFRRTEQLAPGLDARGVLEISFPLGLSHAPDAGTLPRMVSSLEQLPGVRSAGLVTLSLDTVIATDADGIVHRVPIDEDAVSSGTMQTLRVAPIAGRLLAGSDFAPGAAAVVVNERLAYALWPNESPLGKSLEVVRTPSAPAGTKTVHRQLVTIVGAVHAVALDYSPGDVPPAQLFRPFLPGESSDVQALYVRGTRQSPQAMAAVSRAIQSVDAADFFSDAVQPLEKRLDSNLANLRFAAQGLLIGALLAVIVASLGVYGFVAYIVSRQSRDIAIRMALGASRWRAVQNILTRSACLSCLGIACGGFGCLAIAGVISRLGPAILGTWLEPGSLALSVLAVAIVVALAIVIPARRATNAGPTVLRGT